MTKNKISWGIVYSGIFLITLGLVLGNSLVLKVEDINGKHGMKKVVVNIKDLSINKKDSEFTKENINYLKKRMKTDEVTFSAYSQANIKSLKYENIKVIGTNFKYIDFNNLKFKKGFFFNEDSEASNEKILVIDENLAWEYFGSSDVIGKEIEIFEEKFKIVGVQSIDKYFKYTIPYPETFSIYIPVEVLLKLDENSKISSLQIKTNNSYITEKNVKDVVNVLKLIGKDPSDYNIYDYNTKSVEVRQKPLLTMFILGIISIFIIIKFIIYRLKEIYEDISIKAQGDYLINVFKNDKYKIFIDICKVSFMILSIFVVWNIIAFDFFIPKEYISEKLTSIKFLLNLVKDIMWRNLSNTGYILSIYEIKLNAILKSLNYIFYISIFTGLPIIYIGFYRLNIESNSNYKELINTSLIFTLSYVLGVLTTYTLNMPIWLDSKNLGIVLLFIYLNVTLLKKRKEERK